MSQQPPTGYPKAGSRHRSSQRSRFPNEAGATQRVQLPHWRSPSQHHNPEDEFP
jgi:hypothetical protein